MWEWGYVPPSAVLTGTTLAFIRTVREAAKDTGPEKSSL